MLKLKLQYLGHLMRRASSLEKTLMLGKIEGEEEKGMTEDEMVEWHHQFNEHEFEQTVGDSEGQGCLAFYSLLDCKESNMTWPLNNKKSRGDDWLLSSLEVFLFLLRNLFSPNWLISIERISKMHSALFGFQSTGI